MDKFYYHLELLLSNETTFGSLVLIKIKYRLLNPKDKITNVHSDISGEC